MDKTIFPFLSDEFKIPQQACASVADLVRCKPEDGPVVTVSNIDKGGVYELATGQTADNIEVFNHAENSSFQWKRIRQRGTIYAGNEGVKSDGTTDDTEALDDLIQWCQTNDYKLELPPGEILYSSLTAITDGVWIEGQGGNKSNTILRCTNTSGPAIRVKGRSNTLKGFAIAASAARLAATVTDGHGIHVEGDDVAGTVSLSRNRFSDLYIYNQPLDGIHVAGLWELSGCEQVTVADCLRHGFAFDDGTRSGRTNKGGRPFVYHMRQCRAFECAGNGFLFGKDGQTSPPRGLYAEQIESLGCGWDTGVTETAEQILVRTTGAYFINPDVEDQQYASATTSTTDITKTARATPSAGIKIDSDDCTIHLPYFSSLTQSVLSRSDVESVRIENPIFFRGAYSTKQDPAIEIPSSVTAINIKYRSQDDEVTTILQNQSIKGELYIDGERYIPTLGTQFNVKAPNVAEEFTIASGTLEAACNLIAVNGEGGAADTMNRFRYTSPVVGYQGHKVTLIYNGDDITIENGTANLLTSTGSDVMLNATTPVRTLTCYDGSNWFVE